MKFTTTSRTIFLRDGKPVSGGETMRQFFSVGWWLSVVVVGIAVNVFSVYVKQFLDRGNSRAASWWQKRNRQRSEKYEAEVTRLVGDNQGQIIEMFKAQQMRFMELHFTAGAGLFIILSVFVAAYAPSNTIARVGFWSIEFFIFLQMVLAVASSAVARRYERRTMEAYYRTGESLSHK
jgi:membrane protein implicated in regulation of membrane protease activity